MQRELGDDLCGSFEAMTVIVYHFLVDGPSAAEAKLMQVSRFTQLIPVLSECHMPPPPDAVATVLFVQMNTAH